MLYCDVMNIKTPLTYQALNHSKPFLRHKGLLKYSIMIQMSSIIFNLCNLLKYHNFFKMSSIIFNLFFNHIFLILSSVFPQLYKTLQMPFFTLDNVLKM